MLDEFLQNNNIRGADALKYYIELFGFDMGVVHWFVEHKKLDFPLIKTISKSINEASANEIRLLKTKDSYTEEQIILAINTSFFHSFWKRQIFSLAQIRSKCKDGMTKFEHLVMETKELDPSKQVQEQKYELLN